MKRCITQILGLIMAVFMLLPALPGFAEDTVIEEPISQAAVEVILSPDADESVELVPEISLFDDETLMPEETLEASVPEAEEASATKAAVENQPIAANSIPSKLTLGVKETYKIDTSGLKGKMTYKSSETKIVTVSKKGVIKAKKAGNAKITVCAGNTVLAAIELTVKAAPNKVALSKTKLAMNKGETYALQASLPKNTASKITWTSSDKKVASVTADGRRRCDRPEGRHREDHGKDFQRQAQCVHCECGKERVPLHGQKRRHHCLQRRRRDRDNPRCGRQGKACHGHRRWRLPGERRHHQRGDRGRIPVEDRQLGL